MKRYYIDCEFDGFNGALLSMALVGDDEWYEVLQHGPINDPWVAVNVVPFLNKSPISLTDFQQSLYSFLAKHQEVEIVADWPDDIKYFCMSLITAPGMAINTPKIHFVLDRTLTSEQSKVPHNALEDARAIKVSQQN
jgi:hypothetical protein